MTVQAGEPIALDTDVFSFIRNQRGPCDAFAALIDGHPWVLPFPVVGELKYGALRSKHGDRRIAGLEQAIGACTIVTADARAVDRYAALHAKLTNQLHGEGINDLWSAACCLVHDLPIATNNLRDFEKIQGVAPELRIIHPDR